MDELADLRDWLSDKLHEVKGKEFPNADHLQSFANGVEYAVGELLMQVNMRIAERPFSPRSVDNEPK